MSLESRLNQLESKCVGLVPLYVFKLDGELSEKQQAQIDKAEAEGRPVKVVQFDVIKCNQRPVCPAFLQQFSLW